MLPVKSGALTPSHYATMARDLAMVRQNIADLQIIEDAIARDIAELKRRRGERHLRVVR